MSFRIAFDEMLVSYPIPAGASRDAVCHLLERALADVEYRNACELRNADGPVRRNWWYVETANTAFVAHRSIVLGVRRRVELAVPSE